MATNFLMFFSIGSDGVALMVGASGSGLFMAGQWTSGALPFLPFHYPLQSALGRFLLFAVYIVPPLWC